ncbi:cold shock domain-containing protein [Lactobacillus sp. YT155]|uniref:cold-shock protein n=1 Tax=Lactobacillus sp. YT155 TaxID=3060955 RepID=UPI00265FB149|nr:cold shock domain-containing protein [Lactobacillus sp. YT155]MDO1605276.1 cold shock domain-containing protein [Lactobacillus sp. YT155]
MFTGKVTNFDAKKGYGFIEDEKGERYFAFITSFKNRDEKRIVNNCEVEFEVAPGLKGPQAVNINLL